MFHFRTGRKFLYGLGVSAADNRTAVRQLVELQPQILSLYALILINACALAFTHYYAAPTWLTLGVPGVFLPVCVVRSIHWWRLRPQDASQTQAVRDLRRTSVVTVLLSIGFVGWAVMLDAYGDAYQQAHVAVFVAITVIACIFCLTQLPAAAFLVTAIVMGVFLLHYIGSGNNIFVAIAINIAFVTVVMVRILARNFLAFVQLVESQEETQRLIDENERLAYSDSLTGLPNRRFFLSATQRIARAVR